MVQIHIFFSYLRRTQFLPCCKLTTVHVHGSLYWVICVFFFFTPWGRSLSRVLILGRQ